nr:MAG TPA: Polyribonucleotide nucleotidyltransferase, RNA binding domain [Caudoviricetes sp.]
MALVYIKKYKIKLIYSSTTLYNKKGVRIDGRQKKYFF